MFTFANYCVYRAGYYKNAEQIELNKKITFIYLIKFQKRRIDCRARNDTKSEHSAYAKRT